VGEGGPCLVRIEAPQASAYWDYRIPEGLSCDEGVFKTHAHPILAWKVEPDGTVSHEWETNAADFKIISAYPAAKAFGLVFIQGIRYRVSLTPAAHGLDLAFAARNVGKRPLHNIVAFPCLGRPSPNFQDSELKRTFILTEQGLTPLEDTDRGTGDPCRTHFRVADCHAMKFFAEPYWGQASKTVAVDGAILRTRDDGKFTIGTRWEKMCEIFHNEDSHHCIHSVPSLGCLKPDEERTVRGRIVFAAGGPSKALALLRRREDGE